MLGKDTLNDISVVMLLLLVWPFRIFDEKLNSHTWDRVNKLEKGVIYYEGTVKTLQNLTGWYGHKVSFNFFGERGKFRI